MRRYAYKWDKLCAQYGLCDQKSFKTGDVFPTKLPSPDVSLSDYYDDITYDLDDLITKFEVYTKKPISVTSDRYHLKNIINLMMLHYDCNEYSRKINLPTTFYRNYESNIHGNKSGGSGWTQKYKPYTGRCFSFTAPRNLHKAIILSITTSMKQPIEVYLQHPGQFCTWNTFAFSSPKNETFVDVYHEV